MKVRVKPAYGFGWYRHGETTALSVPPDFLFEPEILEQGSPFIQAIGRLNEPAHPLSSLWIYLWQRTRGDRPTYNFRAFPDKPLDPSKEQPVLTGFALLEI